MIGMKKTMNKTAKNNLITYAIAIGAFILMQILIGSGSISSLMQGLLVPLCTYVILAVSLNLVVGILGELSLGHAGFMCVGAFSSAFFSKCMRDTITSPTVRFLCALLIGIVVAAIFGILIGIPVLRLKGDYLAIVTLAFGEIIKNLDQCPLHRQRFKRISFLNKGRNEPEYGSGWSGCIKRTSGNYRSTERFHVFNRIYSGHDYPVYCSKSDSVQRWTCNHGNP